MEMMQRVRRSTDSTWMKIVFGIIVLVFVFWGIGATGPTNAEIAMVNGVRITDTELHREMKFYNTGNSQNDDELRALQQRVIEDLIEDEVLLQEAERVGLEVSSMEIALYLKRMTRSDGTPLFEGVTGNFDDDLYQKFLDTQGYKRGTYEDRIRRDLLRQKLQYLALSSVKVSDEQVWDLYQSIVRKVGFTTIQISEKQLSPLIDVTDEDVVAWLIGNEAVVSAEVEAQRPTFEFEIAEELMEAERTAQPIDDQTDGDVPELVPADLEVEDDDSTEEVGTSNEDEAPQSLPPTPEEISAWQQLHLEDIAATFDSRSADYHDDVAKNLIREERLGQFAQDLAEELRSSWGETGAVPQARLDEINATLEVPIEVYVAPAMSLSEGPSDPEDINALMASFVLQTTPDLAQELSTVSELGVLPEIKPTSGGGWVVLHVDSLELPSRQEFDEKLTFDLGDDPITGEPRVLERERLRQVLWYGPDPHLPRSDDLCVVIDLQRGQPGRSDGEACQFYDRWVDSLVASADVEQLFIP